MKKEIREVQQGVVRVTTTDERWYGRQIADPATKLPVWQYVPSVTWICEYYPKGIGFYKWLANTGWDESQALKEAAGGRGTKVHNAIGDLLDGKTVEIDALYMNPMTGQPESLTLEEYQAVMSFASWHQRTKPITVAKELTVFNDAHGYAGTVDYLCTIQGELWLIDFKTSKSVWPGHRMQVSAYKQANPEWANAKLALLQVGYERNKDGYKLTEIEDCFPLFLASKAIWAAETVGQSPLQRDYPVQISLAPAAAAPGSAATQGATAGGNGHGESGRGTDAVGVRKSGRGRVVARERAGSPVRREP